MTQSAAHDSTAAQLQIVVLASGSGTLLQAIVDSAAQPGARFAVTAVVTDRECLANERARSAGLPTAIVRLADYADRATWDAALAAQVARFQPHLVVSAGFMKILGPAFLAEYSGRTINTHPALLPAFPGAHGVRDALAYGVKVTGCTVHTVDAGVDTGPILAQQAITIQPSETEAELHERIKVVERALIVDTLDAIAAGDLDPAAQIAERTPVGDVNK